MSKTSSQAAHFCALRIRRTPFSLADTMLALFNADETEKDKAEVLITDKLADLIEEETHCGILLRVAEAAKQIPYANQTDELHQALAQWEYLTKPKDKNEPR